MPARRKKRYVVSILPLLVVLAPLVIPGCQSEHRMADVGTDEACPVCQAEVRVTPMTDLTYTVCVCPECKRVSPLEAATQQTVEAYVGGKIGDTVHVCDACETVIERCAVCREK